MNASQQDSISSPSAKSGTKSALLLGTNQGVNQVLAFARNIILARFISKADFGIAATLLMTVSLFDLASNLEPSIQLVQAPDGDEVSFQDTAHSVEVVRGLLNAIAIAATALPLAALFGVPNAGWAFLSLSICPLARGFAHLDRMRVQRQLRYLPFIGTEIAVGVVVTVAAVILALWMRNYAAMLILLILQAIGTAIASHVVAERSYRWRWDRRYLRRILSFGWPLLINGIVLYVIIQGDRAVVATKFGMESLAMYAAALNLIFVPTSAVFRAVGPVFLPIMSRVQHNLPEFDDRYALVCEALVFVGTLIAVPFIAGGTAIVATLYGKNYTDGGAFIAWLAAAQFLRMLRGAPAMAALARGDSRNQMLTNLWRAGGVVISLLVVFWRGGLAWIAFAGFLAELAASVVSAARLYRDHGLAPSALLRVLRAPVGLLSIAAIARISTWSDVAWRGMLLAISLELVSLVALLGAFPRVRRRIYSLVTEVSIRMRRTAPSAHSSLLAGVADAPTS